MRMSGGGPSETSEFVQRTLAAFAGQYASLAALFAGAAPAGEAMRAFQGPLEASYRQLFASAALPGAGAGAAQRMAALVAAVAVDAGERLARALADDAAPPVTTLQALHELWIDCGEEAWAEAAHREEFAEAQAEFLAAIVALGARAAPR
jgi:poly(hydroxyalkanoate) synthase III subunit E